MKKQLLLFACAIVAVASISCMALAKFKSMELA